MRKTTAIGPKPARRPRRAYPVGLWLHTLTADGEIEYQGEVIGVRDARLFVQLYSFIDGCPTIVVVLERELVYDPKRCRLYSCDEDMREHYAKVARRKFA